MAKKPQTIESLVTDIEKRLDSIEDMASFLVKSNTRFKKGQRVQFSPKAVRAGIRAKGGAREGRVVEVSDSFSMKVLVDGYKKPHSYHHAFWEPLRKRGRG